MPLGIIACAIIVPAALCVVESPLYPDGNFETEFMVREIRWDEDCYQVLDDPSVVNRYAFESFHQYLVYCVEKKSRGEPLPWGRDVLASGKEDGFTFNSRITERTPISPG